MPPAEPIPHRMVLAGRLQQLRTGAGLILEDVAEAMDWSLSKTARIEGAVVDVTPTDLRFLLDLYRVADPELRRELEEQARLARAQQAGTFGDVTNAVLRQYLDLECAAVRLWHYEPGLIPDLLRTEAYAEAAYDAGYLPDASAEDPERQLEVCLARQEAVLGRDDPPELWFLIDEAALRRSFDDAIMQGQAGRLWALAAAPNITLQILLLSAGPHLGLNSAFTLLDFAGVAESLVYLHDLRQPVRNPAVQVAAYRRLFHDLARAAAPADAFVTVLDQIMVEVAERQPGRGAAAGGRYARQAAGTA